MSAKKKSPKKLSSNDKRPPQEVEMTIQLEMHGTLSNDVVIAIYFRNENEIVQMKNSRLSGRPSTNSTSDAHEPQKSNHQDDRSIQVIHPPR